MTMHKLQYYLWLGLATAVVSAHIAMVSLTQNSPSLTLMAVLIWGGALICIEDQIPGMTLHPSRLGLILGSGLILASLSRTASILHLDSAALVLPVVMAIGLALLWKPLRQLWQIRDALIVLLLLPASYVLCYLLPELKLSLLTARITQVMLLLTGFDVQVDGRQVLLPGGGVSVGSACAGMEMIAQLIAIAVVFVLAFPMPKRRDRILMLLIAPIIAIAGNACRIALLALINSSSLANKLWWFNFFHEQDGSFVFAAITVSVFGWIYIAVLNHQLNLLEQRPAGSAVEPLTAHEL